MDLGAFCHRVENEISSASGREGIIHVTLDPGLNGDATADEGLLHHILGNLMSNAVKYSPPDRAVELRVVRTGTEAWFIVRDRGCGIPPADQARLFTAFYRGSNVGQTPGSGLGLVITNRCVDLHGGTRVFRRRSTPATRH
jgi:signal transduction histidine kinase